MSAFMHLPSHILNVLGYTHNNWKILSTECKTLGVSQNHTQSLSKHAQMRPAFLIAGVGIVDR